MKKRKATDKPIIVLIMSVGPYKQNKTAKMLEKMGGKEDCVVCLPRQFMEHEPTYTEQGFEVFIYDEQQYINDDFEFFGFKKRNCGGVGRQGIAEAVDRYGDDFLCFQVDDDYSSFTLHRDDGVGKKHWRITDFNDLRLMIYAFAEFYEITGIECGAVTGNIFKGTLFLTKKIFNNFVMRKENALNYSGFAALCSDDHRYNYLNNLLQCNPMLSTSLFAVCFTVSQGQRPDGNAVLYNGDCSWKKSFALKMMLPWCVSQYIKVESGTALFREHINTTLLYPPILIEKGGYIIEKVKFSNTWIYEDKADTDNGE